MKKLILRALQRMAFRKSTGFYYPAEEQKFLQHIDDLKTQVYMAFIK